MDNFIYGIYIISVSILLVLLLLFINKKLNVKHCKDGVFLIITAVITYFSYWAYCGIVYLLNSDCYDAIVENSKIPFIISVAAVSAFFATYFICINKAYSHILKYISDVNRKHIDLQRVTQNTYLLNQLRNTNSNVKKDDAMLFDAKTDEAYVVSYNSTPVGYFFVKNNAERNSKEITEFYALLDIYKNYQILKDALYMFFEDKEDTLFEINGLVKNSTESNTVLQLIIQSYTNSNYEVHTNIDNSYDISFKA